MLEKDMRRLLKHKVSLEMPHMMLQRIESGGTGRGIPDFFFKTIYDEGWIELKEITITSCRISVPWRPGQLPWIKKYAQLRGNIILLMTYKKSTYTIGWEETWIAIRGLDIIDRDRYETIEEFEAATFFMGSLKELNLRKLLQNPYT